MGAMRIAPIWVIILGGVLVLFSVNSSLLTDLQWTEKLKFSFNRPGFSTTTSVGDRSWKEKLASIVAVTSRAQFWRGQNKTGSSDDQIRKELVGLDFSTKTLLSEALQRIMTPDSNLDDMLTVRYGVLAVVSRLVICSAYRTSLQEFTVLTISPDRMHRSLHSNGPPVHPTCAWLPKDGILNPPAEAPPQIFSSIQAMNKSTTRPLSILYGTTNFQYMEETHARIYDCLVIRCSFSGRAGADAAGGLLYLNISHGASFSELVQVFNEPANRLNLSLYQRPLEFKYEYAYCSAPVFTPTVDTVHVKQFLMYHYLLLDAKVHFFIYHSAEIDTSTMKVFQPLIDSGVLTLVDFKNADTYDVWYHNQVIAINDCLLRVRFLARWALVWDLDEYIHIPRSSSLTLPALLDRNKNAPWISLGSITFSLDHCSPINSSGEWAAERMIYREAGPICGPLCDGERGRRKWIGNPREINAARTHRVMDIRNTSVPGVIIHTDIARMNHYHGLISPGKICRKIKDPKEFNSTTLIDNQLLKDDDLSFLITTALRNVSKWWNMFSDA